MGEFWAPGAEIWLFKKTNMDRSIDLAVQHIEKVLCVGGYNWLLCGVSGKEEKNMVAPPLVKAGVLCRGVLLLGCRGAGGGRGPPARRGGSPAAAIRDAACPLWELSHCRFSFRPSVSVRSTRDLSAARICQCQRITLNDCIPKGTMKASKSMFVGHQMRRQ